MEAKIWMWGGGREEEQQENVGEDKRLEGVLGG